MFGLIRPDKVFGIIIVKPVHCADIQQAYQFILKRWTTFWLMQLMKYFFHKQHGNGFVITGTITTFNIVNLDAVSDSVCSVL